MANPNIGHVICPITNKLCVVREDCRGKFYFYSEAGKLTPNLITGQQWLKAAYTRWPSEDNPPDNIIIRMVAMGAPPILEYSGKKEPVKPVPAPILQEKPVTGKGVTEDKPRNALHEFMFGGD
jgi:hypothetical protein